jgi:hypothetical protein
MHSTRRSFIQPNNFAECTPFYSTANTVLIRGTRIAHLGSQSAGDDALAVAGHKRRTHAALRCHCNALAFRARCRSGGWHWCYDKVSCHRLSSFLKHSAPLSSQPLAYHGQSPRYPRSRSWRRPSCPRHVSRWNNSTPFIGLLIHGPEPKKRFVLSFYRSIDIFRLADRIEHRSLSTRCTRRHCLRVSISFCFVTMRTPCGAPELP